MGSVRAHLHKVSSLMKSKSKRQRKFKETLVREVKQKWSNSGRKMKKKKNQRQKGDGRWSAKWRRYQKSGSDSKDLGIFLFFVGLHFTGRYPVFFLEQPVRPCMTRYLERNETAVFLFRPKHWYSKFRPYRPVRYGIDFLDLYQYMISWVRLFRLPFY